MNRLNPRRPDPTSRKATAKAAMDPTDVRDFRLYALKERKLEKIVASIIALIPKGSIVLIGWLVCEKKGFSCVCSSRTMKVSRVVTCHFCKAM